jgi:hypothetical protein
MLNVSSVESRGYTGRRWTKIKISRKRLIETPNAKFNQNTFIQAVYYASASIAVVLIYLRTRQTGCCLLNDATAEMLES